MKISDKVGIDPHYWANQKQADFLKALKGKASTDHLKKVYKEIVSKYKK